ncbi:MAG: winged helix-turn-helix domain-containing protein [Acidobacteria bacterium]|nr:winged helix-turn-helix domain-containing protein [Acidobacteriota bacterium]
MSKLVKHFYEFAPFRIDATERVLLRDEEPVPLTPKVFDTLLVLVQHSGHIFEVNELMEKIWPDTVVEENNLRQSISTLRKVLGDNPSEPRYIETIPRRGYRFVAEVKEQWEEPDEVLLVERTRAHVVIHEEEQGKENGRMGEWAHGRTEKNISHSPTLPFSHSFSSPTLPFSHSLTLFLQRRKLLAASVLLVGVSVAVGLWLRSQSSHSQAQASVKFIAVLPFKTIGGETEDEHLGLGVADARVDFFWLSRFFRKKFFMT